MECGKSKIDCHIFQKYESKTKEITNMIDTMANIKKRVQYAEELLKEIEILLNCPEYKQESFECRNCRTIADLRKETAELIIKVRQAVAEGNERPR